MAPAMVRNAAALLLWPTGIPSAKPMGAGPMHTCSPRRMRAMSGDGQTFQQSELFTITDCGSTTGSCERRADVHARNPSCGANDVNFELLAAGWISFNG
jgi:hypothetical protein